RSGEWLEANPTRVKVGGRLMFKRLMGKASFAKIADRTGQIQLYLQQETLGEAYDAFKSFDVGDTLAAGGVLFRTKTGELSGRGAPLPHASQRARSRHVPAHRAGAVPEASHRRRLRAGVRDQPQLPQRRPVDAAQPRIHDARAVPRVRRLP